MSTPPPRPPEGWYADPDTDGQLRWWDGQRWGDATRPVDSPAATSVDPAAVQAERDLRDLLDLPLKSTRRRRINAPPESIWRVAIDPDRLHEWVPSVSASTLLSGEGAGRRVRITGKQLGLEMDGIQVLDLVERPHAIVFHYESVLMAGKPVDYGEAHQHWLTITPEDGYAEVEVGAGFRPGSRRKAVELRASMTLLGRQHEQTLAALEQQALRQPVLARPEQPAPVPPTPAPSRDQGPSKKVQAAYFGASLGARTRHAGVRGASQLTLKALDRHVSKRAGQQPSKSQGDAVYEHVSTVLDNIQHFVKQPPRAMLNFYGAFGQEQGLSRDALTFAIGAAHIGYSVRRTEERLFASNPTAIPAVTDFLRAAWAMQPEASDADVVHMAGVGYGRNEPWEGSTLDVMYLPWNPPHDRELWRDSSLKLLTNPGAQFRARPTGINHAQVLQSWAYGFAARCAEMSLPSVTGKRYTTFKPQV